MIKEVFLIMGDSAVDDTTVLMAFQSPIKAREKLEELNLKNTEYGLLEKIGVTYNTMCSIDREVKEYSQSMIGDEYDEEVVLQEFFNNNFTVVKFKDYIQYKELENIKQRYWIHQVSLN